MKRITVEKCLDCPFYDTEPAYSDCNHKIAPAKKINLEEVPPFDCPLREDSYLITINAPSIIE